VRLPEGENKHLTKILVKDKETEVFENGCRGGKINAWNATDITDH
jgi:hypothetical protein